MTNSRDHIFSKITCLTPKVFKICAFPRDKKT